jgi:hypothetical protein
MIRPSTLLEMFPGKSELKAVADEVERETIQMIEEAKTGRPK